MKERNVKHSIEMIYPLLFILVFCFCMILVIFSGANIYKKTTAGLQENYTIRTAVPYIQEKIRECEDHSQIEVLLNQGECVLALYSNRGKITYATYIYKKEGYLCELFTKKSESPSYNAGQSLVALDSFYVEQQDSLLYVTVKKNQEEEHFVMHMDGMGEIK